MNIIKNGYIVDNLNNTVIDKAKHEVHQNAFGKFSLDDLTKIFNQWIITPVFRLFLLDDDERIIKDISPDFISGDLSCTYQSGKRRTLNISLLNGHGQYTPHGRNYSIYLGCKFRLDAGVLIDDTIYWFQQGIFLLQDPMQSSNDSDQVVTFNLHDKFSLFDGTVSGTTYLKTILPVDVPMRQAFINIISANAGNGKPFDCKPLIFNSQYTDVKTQKTIRQDFGSNLGDILIDCANTISSDVYYNVYGNMVVESNVNQFLNGNFPMIFRLSDGDKIVRDHSLNYNWSKLRNKIIVKGAIVNGYQFSGSAENNSILSPFNVKNRKISLRAETISDSKLYSDSLCKEKAMYTLIERQRGVKTLNLSTGYLPFIDVNQSFAVTFADLQLDNETFIIDSFNMSISSEPSMSVNLSNIGEVVF